MRETYHEAAAEVIREALLDQVSPGPQAEQVADQAADGLADEFGMPDREVGDVAEVLAHVGIGPDEVTEVFREGLERLARKAAEKLVRRPPGPDDMPREAYAAMVRLRVRARRKVGAAHWQEAAS